MGDCLVFFKVNINHLLILLWRHWYLLYTWGFSLILLYFVAQNVKLWSLEDLAVGSFVPLVYSCCYVFVFWFFFLALQHALDSPCVFPTPMGESTTSPKSPDSSFFFFPFFFSWFLLMENGIRNQNLLTRCGHCYWSFIASRPSQLTEPN